MLWYMIVMNEGINLVSWYNEMRQFLVNWINMMGLKLRMISGERCNSEMRIVLSRCHFVLLIHRSVRLS